MCQSLAEPLPRLRPRSPGFTLLELLVAVAILAIALLAAFKALAQASHVLREGQLRQMATWVAENRAASLRARQVFPAPSAGELGQEQRGEERQGGILFAWHSEFKATPNSDFLRVETTVREADRPEQELARLTSFLRRPR